MIAAILTGLAKTNLAAGVGVLLVMTLRNVVRPRFGARAAYVLWLAPLVAGAAVLLPHPLIATPMSPIVLSAETVAVGAADEFSAQAPIAVWHTGVDVMTWVFAVWLAGALGAAALVLWRQARFSAAMGRLTPSDAPGVFRAASPHVGPAVVGAFRPRIVTPADFETRFAPGERNLILAHEEAHLRGGDASINALACALQCLCWFNPLAHVAARALRIDQELACDAAVIGRFPDVRRAYAELLLKTQITTQALPLGCHWPARADHPLKERIAMLKSPLPRLPMRVTGMAVAVIATLTAGGLGWAAQPGPGSKERLAAQAAAALHPSDSCDSAGEARGEGCKIVRVQDWLAVPTHSEVMRYYPRAALKAGVTADVRISCGITPIGLLKSCAPVETEIKAQDGVTGGDDTRAAFGKAAVALSRYYQWHVIEPRPRIWPANAHAGLRIVFDPDPTAGAHLPGPPGAMPARPMPPLPSTARSDVRIESRTTAERPVVRTPASYSPTAAPALIRQPDWIEKPIGADLARFYPAEAEKQHFEGTTVLSCGVDKDGRLTNCAATGITTFGVPDAIREDFRKAALELAGLFRMRPQSVDGVATAEGRINVPIRWSLPTDPQAAARLDGLRDPGPSAPR